VKLTKKYRDTLSAVKYLELQNQKNANVRYLLKVLEPMLEEEARNYQLVLIGEEGMDARKVGVLDPVPGNQLSLFS
jgi:hypothetical protein